MERACVEVRGLSAGVGGWGVRGDSHPHECQGCVCKQSPFTKGCQSCCCVSDFMDVSRSFEGLADHMHGKVI